MSYLTNRELTNINGGATFYTPFDWIYKIYRTIKIKLLMRRLFVN